MMLGGVFDPFENLGAFNQADNGFPSIHVGVVKSYSASTNSVMVLVSTINTANAIGPCKVMKHYDAMSGTRVPTVGDKAVVALIDGSPNGAIILGYL